MSPCPLPPALMLLLAASALAQKGNGDNEGKPHIDGGQNSTVAITGVVIGGILVTIALLAVLIYAIDQYLYRRRLHRRHSAPPTKANPSTYAYRKFTRLPTDDDDDDESYRYLVPLPPAASLSISPTKANARKDYGHGPFYPEPIPITPLSAGSTVVPTSPFYPGSFTTPPTPKRIVVTPTTTIHEEPSSAGVQTVYFEPYSSYPSHPASPNSLPPGAMSPQSAASFRTMQSQVWASGGNSVRSARSDSEPQRLGGMIQIPDELLLLVDQTGVQGQ